MIQSEDLSDDRPYNVPKEDKRAKFELIVAWIENKIRTGEWPIGHQLPSQTAWRTKYGVYYGTLRGAYLQLKIKGYIEGAHGEGVYVLESELTPPRAVRYAPRVIHIGKRRFVDPTAPEGRSLGI